MPKPRSSLIAIESTPYYHCVSRCVRRAFLCGHDHLSNISYEHRRGWVENKLLSLPQVFTIDICAYAIMSNHYHVVLHIHHEKNQLLTDEEVIERWHTLFSGTVLSQKFMRNETLTDAEKLVLNQYISEWRKRLMSISWFMRVLNESIARQANQEDNCTGRFWEGRFKSQALLDEKALAACMVYVDLNPIRARIAKTPEHSDYTSIKQRSEKAQQVSSPNHPGQQVTSLFPFAGNPRKCMPEGLPFKLTDYLMLVDETARIQREDKHGAMNTDQDSILKRLSINGERWIEITGSFEDQFSHFVGAESVMTSTLRDLGYTRTPDRSHSAYYFN